jgi:hypothetical protein
MQARQLPARHGALWFFGGFQLFRRNPPLLTALTFAYLFCVILLNLVPLVGPLLLPLVLPALTLIVANGCRAIDLGRPPGKLELLGGIEANRVALIRLGGLNLLGSVLVLAVSTLVEGGPQELPTLDQVAPAEMLGLLARLLLIAAPVIMAFWFAPLLTGWDGVPALKSAFFSFVACLRNWRAFAVFGLTLAAVAVGIPGLVLIGVGAVSSTALNVLSVALRMLLMFIVAPVLMASVYLSYRDVFHPADENA